MQVLDNTKQIFIKNLKQLRKSKKITQERFAELINKATRTYQSYETGEVFPSPDALESITEVLGCKLSDLFREEAHATPSPQMTAEQMRNIAKEILFADRYRPILEILATLNDDELQTAFRAVKAISEALEGNRKSVNNRKRLGGT